MGRNLFENEGESERSVSVSNLSALLNSLTVSTIRNDQSVTAIYSPHSNRKANPTISPYQFQPITFLLLYSTTADTQQPRFCFNSSTNVISNIQITNIESTEQFLVMDNSTDNFSLSVSSTCGAGHVQHSDASVNHVAS